MDEENVRLSSLCRAQLLSAVRTSSGLTSSLLHERDHQQLYIYRPAATPKVQRLVKCYYPPRHFNHSLFAPSLLFGYNLTV